MFAIEHSQVAPDLLLSGKSLAAGLPLAGVTGRCRDHGRRATGGLGATFGGNPVACAAGLAVLEVFAQERLWSGRPRWASGWRRGWTAGSGIRARRRVAGARAMRAIELVADRTTRNRLPLLLPA